MTEAAVIRPARPEDIPDLAALLLAGTDGIVESLYEGLVPGKTTAEILARRFLREGTTGALAHCWSAVQNERAQARVLGQMQAFPIDLQEQNTPDPLIPEERYVVAEPFDVLDAAVPGSFYINVISVYPEYQGQGLGKRFLALAEAQTRRHGLTTLSLACFEENPRALALYRREGFEEVARAPAAKHPRIRHGGDILMLAKGV